MVLEKNSKRYRSVPLGHMLRWTSVSASTPIQKLNKELLQAYDKIKLSKEEMLSRDEVFAQYKALLEEKLKCRVESFGSTRTRMLVHGSDIDITLITSQGQLDDEKAFANIQLAKARQVLEASRLLRGDAIHIRKARTPILKLTDRRFGYKIDISVNKADGIETADFVLAKLTEHPQLKYLVVLLKYFLKRRGLSDTACGGLCAYAQFLLLLDFVQLHPLLQNGSIEIQENLGVILMDFFQYYGIDFPFERSAISVTSHGYKPNVDGPVCIEDPVNAGNNVAGGCTTIKRIKDVFAHSYKIMASALSSKVDQKKSVVDLWLRIDSAEMKVRQEIVKYNRK